MNVWSMVGYIQKCMVTIVGFALFRPYIFLSDLLIGCQKVTIQSDPLVNTTVTTHGPFKFIWSIVTLWLAYGLCLRG